MYLLDYEPSNSPAESETVSSPTDNLSDTLSISTEPNHYGQLFGASAVSAFGGPHSPQQPPSFLTVHALPSRECYPDSNRRSNPQRRRSDRTVTTTTATVEPSPLATKEPNLLVHSRMYAAGQRLGVDGLKALALDKFKIQLTRHWCVQYS